MIKARYAWRRTKGACVHVTQGILIFDISLLRIDKKKKESDVQYCPTKIMLGYFFTKLLQGALFRKFRDVVMG